MLVANWQPINRSEDPEQAKSLRFRHFLYFPVAAGWLPIGNQHATDRIGTTPVRADRRASRLRAQHDRNCWTVAVKQTAELFVSAVPSERAVSEADWGGGGNAEETLNPSIMEKPDCKSHVKARPLGFATDILVANWQPINRNQPQSTSINCNKEMLKIAELQGLHFSEALETAGMAVADWQPMCHWSSRKPVVRLTHG